MRASVNARIAAVIAIAAARGPPAAKDRAVRAGTIAGRAGTVVEDHARNKAGRPDRKANAAGGPAARGPSFGAASSASAVLPRYRCPKWN